VRSGSAKTSSDRIGVGAALVVFAIASLSPSAGAVGQRWDFRTPGDAAYCRLELGGLRCIRPNDGLWIRITVSSSGIARITKGYAHRWRAFRDRTVRTLGYNRAWLSSDAALLTCVSRRTGLTCNYYKGRAFWLGRYRGYRIYRGPPGSVPTVDPFFRTTHGVWCGNSSVLEPTYMILDCWRVNDGTTVSLPHSERKRNLWIVRNPHARNYRPPGFPLVRPGETFILRCRRVTPRYADHCAPRGLGRTVFTCRAPSPELRCENRFGRGFVLGPRSVTSF
jgi:hypothetical protein